MEGEEVSSRKPVTKPGKETASPELSLVPGSLGRSAA